MEQVIFTVPGEPQGKGRPRFSRYSGSAYTPEKTLNYENLVGWEYRQQTDNFTFGGNKALKMEIDAFYGIPKSKSKKVKAQMMANEIRPTKKPDMDNVVKIIADSLNNIAYHDDTQIVECICRKYYAEEPRVTVKIEEMTHD